MRGSGAVTSARPPDAARHAVAVYESGDDLRARAVPYLRAGLDAGEAVVVAVTRPAAKALQSGLGPDAGRIRWDLPGLSYGHLGRTSEVLRAFLAGQRKAGAPTRLLAEHDTGDMPGGPGRTAAYLRAEAAATELYGGDGFAWACLYHRRRSPAGVLADAYRVHPWLLGPGGRLAPSAAYVPPADYLAAHPGPVSPVPASVALDVQLTETGGLAGARHQVAATARALGLPPADCRAVEIATGEIIGNVFRHGVPPGRIRMWRDSRAVLVRVDDSGPGGAVAVAGFRPPDLTRGSGAGLWIARQLADVMHVQFSPAGTAVEMQFPLG